jgi:hypothetical protein
MFKTQRFELVEIQIGSNTARKQFNFPDLPNLTGRDGNPVIIDSIVSYNSDTGTIFSPISGSQIVASGVVGNTALTIYQGDLQVLYQIPLTQLSFTNLPGAVYAAGVMQQPALKDLINVSWTKSFITYADTAALTANQVFLFGVHYTVISGTPFVPTVENQILETLAKQNQLLLQMSNQLSRR